MRYNPETDEISATAYVHTNKTLGSDWIKVGTNNAYYHSDIVTLPAYTDIKGKVTGQGLTLIIDGEIIRWDHTIGADKYYRTLSWFGGNNPPPRRVRIDLDWNWE